MKPIYLALLGALVFAPALADDLPIPPAQHGLFDGGAFPPAAQGFATLGTSGGMPLKAVPYASLPVSAPTGTTFFCTNCGSGKPVFFNGTGWVDATGAGVQHP